MPVHAHERGRQIVPQRDISGVAFDRVPQRRFALAQPGGTDERLCQKHRGLWRIGRERSRSFKCLDRLVAPAELFQ
jgi:hypothetical protein